MPQSGDPGDRILNAALEHAADGYDSVQIRSVAHAAGLTPTVLYQYFSSKDDLLIECLLSWLSVFAPTASIDAIGTFDPFHRLLLVVESLTEQMALTPRLADTLVRAYLRAVGPAARKADRARDMLVQLFADAMNHNDGNGGEYDRQVAALVADVWIANVLAIGQSRSTLHELRWQIRRTIELLRKNARYQKVRAVAHSQHGA